MTRRTERKGLATKYVLLGSALCKLESANLKYGRVSHRAYREFRTSISFLSTELLESYWDDLLNWRIPDAALFIEHQARYFTREAFYLGSALLAAAAALALEHFDGTSYTGLVLVISGIVAARGVFMREQSIPQRRLRFGEILAFEIAHRRGNKRTGRLNPLGGKRASAINLREPELTPDFAGAAKVIIH